MSEDPSVSNHSSIPVGVTWVEGELRVLYWRTHTTAKNFGAIFLGLIRFYLGSDLDGGLVTHIPSNPIRFPWNPGRCPQYLHPYATERRWTAMPCHDNGASKCKTKGLVGWYVMIFDTYLIIYIYICIHISLHVYFLDDYSYSVPLFHLILSILRVLYVTTRYTARGCGWGPLHGEQCSHSTPRTVRQ